MTLAKKAVKIKAIVMDIDGVLTDGRMGYSSGSEIKFFHVRDGHGLKLAMRAGLKVGALSGRSSEANKKRAEELCFDFLYENKKDKKAAFEVLLSENDLTAEECLYIGDDVIDIPVMRQAGIAVAVADAASMVADYCDFSTKLCGGCGAVRETVEWLLKEQNKWDEQVKKYIS